MRSNHSYSSLPSCGVDWSTIKEPRQRPAIVWSFHPAHLSLEELRLDEFYDLMQVSGDTLDQAPKKGLEVKSYEIGMWFIRVSTGKKCTAVVRSAENYGLEWSLLQSHLNLQR